MFCGLATLVLLTLTLSNCSKETGTSSSGSGMNLKIAATNQIFNIPVPNIPDPTIDPGSVNTYKPFVRWDTANIVISKVLFEAVPMGSIQIGEAKEQLIFTGPKFIDLFSAGNILPNLTIPPGQYKEIEFKIYANKSDAGDKPVFYLSGRYQNSSGTAIPIIIDITDDVVITAEKNGVTLTFNSTVSRSGMIRIYLDKLFSSILPQDLNPIVGPGGIIISATSNPELYKQILLRLSSDGAFEGRQ